MFSTKAGAWKVPSPGDAAEVSEDGAGSEAEPSGGRVSPHPVPPVIDCPFYPVSFSACSPDICKSMS